jgi:hypothetical protein
MRRNIILIPPCYTYGDTLSIIGLYYFLLKYYENVHLWLFDGYDHNSREYLKNYFNAYFENDSLFGKRLHIINDPTTTINNSTFGEYDICNTLTAGWDKAQFNFYDLDNIDKEYYFNDLNPLYNKFDIEKKYLCKPNKHLPNNDTSINHKFYYELVGLNNNVRMNYFNYERNYTKELEIKQNILNKHNITGQYNIINDPIGHTWNIFIKNEYPTINISNLGTCVGELSLLVEGAETIHFIEGNNINFFYHSQYNNIFNYNKEIKFHIWLRDRNWLVPNLMLDSAWRMMDEPKLTNWKFIFNHNEI